MASWHEGYVSDVPYALGHYRELTPPHVGFCAAISGLRASLSPSPRRVLELGFGMGLGFVLTAAANPALEFEGCDFNPEHALHARDLAQEAGIANATISDASFQDIERRAADCQADTDLIALHGVLSWVSGEARAAIVAIAHKRLRLGGLLYASYNCFPGWAQLAPLQRLMREIARQHAGSSIGKVEAGLNLIRQLINEKGNYFEQNNLVTPRFEKLLGMGRSYLAHEYLNADWRIFHFADVAELFGAAKLSFVASATVGENIDAVSVPEPMRPRIAAATDAVWKETLRDFASNKQFRRDIFVKGALAATPQENAAYIDGFRFRLAVPRSHVTFKIPSLLGELDANPEIYGPMCDLLSIKESSVPEISSLPAFSGVGRVGALQAISLMVHTGQVLPIAPGFKPDVKPAQRFNRVVAERLLQARVYNFLAAPVVGSGIPASNTEVLMLGALHRGTREEAGKLAEAVVQAMKKIGISPVREGQPVTDEARKREIMAKDAESFLSDTLPVWKRLGVV